MHGRGQLRIYLVYNTGARRLYRGSRTSKNICSCKPIYRRYHACLTGKSSVLTKEKWGAISSIARENEEE